MFQVITKEPDCHKVYISPDMARDWLGRVPDKQRCVRERRVEAMVLALKEGRFMPLTGATIVFDRLGRCIDGQHRLRAIARANIATTSFVVTGVDPDAIYYVDHNMGPRSLADDFKIKGEKNCHILAGAARLLWRWEHNKMRARDLALDIEQVGTTIENNPELRTSLAYGDRVRRILSRSIGAFLHYVFSLSDPETAEWFLRALADGSGLSRDDETSGVLLFRERMLHARGRRENYMAPEDKVALAFKAWNGKRQGVVIRALKFLPTEDFPEVL